MGRPGEGCWLDAAEGLEAVSGVSQPYDGKPPVGKLTAAHKRFLKLQAETDAQITKLRWRLTQARVKLVENCTHPAEFVVEYVWEHDNGYGRQARKKGVRCTICDARCSWPGSSMLWSRSHQRSRDD